MFSMRRFGTRLKASTCQSSFLSQIQPIVVRFGVMERIGMTRSPADDFEHSDWPEGHPFDTVASIG